MAMREGIISHKGNGNGYRGRPYGLMLLLAFGAALLGVIALHKLRERRIFNLLVEEKSRQLISPQLLLRREKECTKEMKRKAEETKAKIYSLRNQKMELDRRLLEMQSTIDSLKDEQRTMESELEEKQKEIKLLRYKDMESGNENPQLIALTATLKQKEAEIEDLKHRLESPVRVWSVSTDDPSNPPVNITVMGSLEQKKGGRVYESSAYKSGDNSTKAQEGNEITSNFPQEEDIREGVEDGSEKRGESTLGMDMAGGGQLQKQVSLGENARNEGPTGEMKNEYSKHTGTSGIDGEKNHANATEKIDDVDEQEEKSSFTGQLGKLKNPQQQAESQKLQRIHKGGKKLKIDEISRISRLPGKRWRILARNRFLKKNVNSEIDGAESMTSRGFSKEYKDVVRSREEGAVYDEGKQREETETGLRNEMDLTNANLTEHLNSEDTEDMKHRKVSAAGEYATSRNHDNSQATELPENTGVNEEVNNYTHDAKQLKVEEAARIKQNMNSRDVKELEKKAELNSTDGDEMEEDMEFADKEEQETEAANGDLSTDFMSDSEDKEGYMEETNETEF
ncbi:LOW QUALITY PROTEIN: dentin matrix acidic phosphoprotein 1-like [Durio zibethinus]|uniref:LOW QUALITY PROTEIN: dentin matrix acidic phosphoprotein 1-like n=1 Tax=Durio zibethinus TaxID=66656 RepID=A0A6P5YPI6_DURZI|nr:LOW QUALITY PROTEIN: dentin matrix acidic phosphoprotein 1-like [Durio zibethinus]